MYFGKMKIRDVISYSFNKIRRGGLKTVLCIAAVFIGILSVCTAFTAGEMSKTALKNELSEIGIRGSALYTKNGEGIGLNKEQIKMLEKTDGVESLMPFSVETGGVYMNKQSFSALVIGADENLQSVWDIKVLYGRSFDKTDVEEKRNVAIIDSDFSNKVFKRSNTVGKRLFLSLGDRTEYFEIIGIVKSQKSGLQSILGASVPEIVYIPSSFSGSADKIAVICSGEDSVKACSVLAYEIKEISGVDLDYKDLDVYADSFLKIGNIVAGLAAAMGFISLIVGGIGVTCNMLSAADERRREIGILLSLGAGKKDILLTFLFESVLLCMIGGGLALSACAAIAGTAMKGYNGVPLFSGGVFGIIVSLLCGSVFGIIPAVRASMLDPAEAMREY